MKMIVPFGAILALVAAQTPDVAALIRMDQKQLQGKWRVIAAESKGEKVPAKDLDGMFLIFEDDTIQVMENKKVQVRYKYLLKPDRKPKQIDFSYTAGPKKDRTDRGIYQFLGERLTFCIQEDATLPRPSEFKTDAEVGMSLVVLQRVK
jgi:uncharacterized protein (TIGR03067 family)